MAKHPLDISFILKKRGIQVEEGFEPKKTKQAPKAFKKVNHPVAPFKKSSPESSESKKVRIEKQLWDLIPAHCRSFFARRVWSEIDFNPLLKDLQDISKLSPKWLHWALPMYVNGLKEGPIKDWVESKDRSQSLHHLLVQEHQNYRKHNKPNVVRTENSMSPLLLEISTNSSELEALSQKMSAHLSWLEA